MVPVNCQTELDAPRLDFWSGLGDALSRDGRIGLGGLASKGDSQSWRSLGVLRCPVDRQRSLVVALFWTKSDRRGYGRSAGAGSVGYSDPGALLASETRCWFSVDAVPALDMLRGGVEFPNLATQPGVRRK